MFRGQNSALNRSASACEAGLKPGLAYLVFKLSTDPKNPATKDIEKDLRSLHCLPGYPQDFPFYLIEIEMSSTPAYDKIKELPEKVRKLRRR